MSTILFVTVNLLPIQTIRHRYFHIFKWLRCRTNNFTMDCIKLSSIWRKDQSWPAISHRSLFQWFYWLYRTFFSFEWFYCQISQKLSLAHEHKKPATCSWDSISHTDNMSKFYEVSKVLDKRTDTHGPVQFLVRWRGYGKKYDSWVDEADTNEHLTSLQAAPSGLSRTAANPSSVNRPKAECKDGST